MKIMLRNLSWLVILLLLNKNAFAVTNYTFTRTSGVPDPMTTGVTVVNTATWGGTGNTDEGWTGLITLPFTFTFNGTAYTTFSISTNGLIRLGAVGTAATNTNSLISGTEFPRIAPFWSDLNIGSAGGGYLRYMLSSGTAPNRKAVIEWRSPIPKSSTTVFTQFQLWLNENGTIQFVSCGTPATSTPRYTMGIAASTSSYQCITTTTSTAAVSTTSVNNSNSAAQASGVTMNFTPPLSCPNTFSPASSSTGILPNRTISWSGAAGNITGYDVYFGTSPTPPLVSSNQTSTSYTPASQLAYNTTYYWEVRTKSATTTLSSCSVQSFTTLSLPAFSLTRNRQTSFSSISSTGSSITDWRNSVNTDDNLSNAIPIGFNFSYQGASLSQVLVSTNGFITFNTTTSSTGSGTAAYGYENGTLSSGAAGQTIAPFYEDMVCQGNPGTSAGLTSSIKYLTNGTSPNRVFTVEWINMETFNNSGPNLNFQVKLYETSGKIEFIYGSMEGFNGSNNYIYSYSCGMTSLFTSTPLIAGEVFNQLADNTTSFGSTATSDLKTVPECNTTMVFVPGTYQAVVITNAAPTNDNTTGAIQLGVQPAPCTELCGTYYTTLNATASGQTACAGNADDDVWFKFNATNTTATLKLLCSGSFTGAIELYNSSFQQIGCTSSSIGAIGTLNATGLIISQTYFVRIYDINSGSGVAGSRGQFSLCVSATPVPPVNDECSAAISIPVTTSSVFTVGQQTSAATASANIPTCSLTTTVPDDDVWYRFTASNPATIITLTSGTGFDGVFQVLTGTCASLASVTCVNSVGTAQTESTTLSNLIAGQNYFIRVYNSTVGGGSGNHTLNIASVIPSCPTGGYNPPNGTGDVSFNGTTLRWNRVPNADNYRLLLDSASNPPQYQVAITTDTFFVTHPLQAGLSYYWQVQPGNVSGRTTCSTNFFAIQPDEYPLNIRAYVEGSYLNGEMRNVLNRADTMVDSITVQLVNPTSKAVSYSSTALISNNGYSAPTFPQPAIGQSYYIVIKHHNSLETWSSVIFNFSQPDTLYNFALNGTSAFQSNMIQMANGLWAIHTGDVNQDGFINIGDLNVMQTSMSQFLSGYRKEDLNGDGVAESADFSFIENKFPSAVQVRKP